MLLGLHWTAWLLVFVATVPAAALAGVFYRVHTRGEKTPEEDR